MEAGDRPDAWSGALGPKESGGESYDPHNLRWGPNIGDILYKREHVAILRGPSTTRKQEKAIGSIVRQLPPLAEMRHLTEAENVLVQEQQRGINKMLMSAMTAFDASNPGVRKANLLSQNDEAFGKMHSRIQLPDGQGTKETQLLMLFLKSQDMTAEQIEKISSRVAMCPYALGARFVSEQVIPQVGTFRLEVVMDADHSASLNEDAASGFEWKTKHAV